MLTEKSNIEPIKVKDLLSSNKHVSIKVLLSSKSNHVKSMNQQFCSGTNFLRIEKKKLLDHESCE